MPVQEVQHIQLLSSIAASPPIFSVLHIHQTPPDGIMTDANAELNPVTDNCCTCGRRVPKPPPPAVVVD